MSNKTEKKPLVEGNTQHADEKSVTLVGLYGSPIEVPIKELPILVDDLISTAFNALENSYSVDDCEFDWNSAQLIKAGLNFQFGSIVMDILYHKIQNADTEQIDNLQVKEDSK